MRNLKLETSNSREAMATKKHKEKQRGGTIGVVRSAFFLLAALATLDVSAENLLLSNAVVHTITGETIIGGQVFVAEGKISAVGTNITAPNVKTLDLAGQHLYPGLIALD